MKYIVILFVIITDMMADSFLGNMYIDLRELNLTYAQQKRLKDIMKSQHEFLKQWYAKAKSNNDRIMESFSTSSLDKDSLDLSDSINLATSRLRVEQDFLIAVYEVLDEKQRAIFGEKLKDREKQEEDRILKNIEPKIESSESRVESSRLDSNNRNFKRQSSLGIR